MHSNLERTRCDVTLRWCGNICLDLFLVSVVVLFELSQAQFGFVSSHVFFFFPFQLYKHTIRIQIGTVLSCQKAPLRAGHFTKAHLISYV